MEGEIRPLRTAAQKSVRLKKTLPQTPRNKKRPQKQLITKIFFRTPSQKQK